MNFRISTDGNSKDIAEIKDMLEAYNTAKGAKAEKTPLGVYYEDGEGKKLAGLTGDIFGNWFFIDFLFVSDCLRGQGIGKKLLATAEEEAKKRGCKYAFLYTNAFQAPGFYEKLGYKCVFSLKEFPKTGERFYYTKEL